MSAPTNTTPATATAITSLPYAVTVVEADVTLVPTGTGYASTCDATQYHALWWKYTTGSRETVLAVKADVTDPLASSWYSPALSIWTGPLGSLTQYTFNDGQGNVQNFCGTGFGGYWFEVPVTPSTTYYFQVVDQNNTSPLGVGLDLRLQAAPVVLAPVGSLLIPDDTDDFPAAILSATTGAFLRIIPFPAGEFGASVVTGEFCVQDREADTAVRVLAADLTTTIGRIDYAPRLISAITSDLADTFYVLTRAVSGGVGTVHTVSRAGVGGGTTWSLPVVGKTATVTRNGHTLYYAARSGDDKLRAFDLIGNTALADLAASIAGQSLVDQPFVASDGTIWFGYHAAADGYLRQYNAAGTLLQTVALTGLVNVNKTALDPDDLSAWIWGVSANGHTATFRHVRLSDGVTLGSVPSTIMSDSGAPNEPDAPFAISNSCPLLLLVAALATPTCPNQPVIASVGP